ncbi:MAG: nitroreductase family protein [Candidatus Bipolaricaulota bacterium]
MSGPIKEFALQAATGETIHARNLWGKYVLLGSSGGEATPALARALDGLVPRLAPLDAVAVVVASDPVPVLAELTAREGWKVLLVSDPEGAMGQTCQAGELILLDRVGIVRWRGHDPAEAIAALADLRSAEGEVNPLLRARRAYRALAPDPIPREALVRLVEAAHLAPSCFNNQPWRFVIAEGEALARVKAALSGGNYWAKRAPAILALASHRDLDCKLSDGRDYYLFGCGMATGLLMIQATQMGLIAHPIAGYDPLAVKEALGIPNEYVLITLIVVGKPGAVSTLSDKHRAIELGPRERKPLPAVLAWNKFGDLNQTEGT